MLEILSHEVFLTVLRINNSFVGMRGHRLCLLTIHKKGSHQNKLHK